MKEMTKVEYLTKKINDIEAKGDFAPYFTLSSFFTTLTKP
jgi:hypothetical protein